MILLGVAEKSRDGRMVDQREGAVGRPQGELLEGVSVLEEPEVMLTVGAVASQLGVAVPTLRSWDRRYGLGPSKHDPGRHRRYTSQDLARLRRMITLTGEGFPPAAAARLALHQQDEEVPARDGGGSGTVAVGRADRAVRGMARVATRLDAVMMRGKVESHLQHRGALRTWEELLVPLLRSIGDSGAQDVAETVAIEHTATLGILAALHGIRPASERGRLPALLTCAPEEQHSLPLEALHAALAEERCSARFLGARVPSDTLVRTAQKLRPRNIVIWAHAASTARKVVVDELAPHCSGLLLAGPGWSGVRAARDFEQPTSLRDAVRAVIEAAP